MLQPYTTDLAIAKEQKSVVIKKDLFRNQNTKVYLDVCSLQDEGSRNSSEQKETLLFLSWRGGTLDLFLSYS